MSANKNTALTGMTPLREQYKLVSNFDTAYWSGTDVEVYANNILLDSVQLNYQVMERVQPYYGYASYVPDRIMHGNRLITGELTLNFTRFNYMFSLLEILRRQTENEMWLRRPKSEQRDDNTIVNKPVPFTNYPWGPQSNSQIRTKEFTAEQAEQFILAKKRGASAVAVNKNVGVVQQNAGVFETSLAAFDLNIVLGGSLASPSALRFNIDEDSYANDGEVSPMPPKMPGTIGTGEKILRVEIQSRSISLDDSGRNFMETYSFLARDVVPLTSEAIVNLSVNRKAAAAALKTQGTDPRLSVGSSYGRRLPDGTPDILYGGNQYGPGTSLMNQFDSSGL